MKYLNLKIKILVGPIINFKQTKILAKLLKFVKNKIKN